jgi:copper chaperone CopZ
MTTVLRSGDLACTSCAANLETFLKMVKGVQDVTVHGATGRIEIRYDPMRIGFNDLVRTIRATGYEVHVSPLG